MATATSVHGSAAECNVWQAADEALGHLHDADRRRDEGESAARLLEARPNKATAGNIAAQSANSVPSATGNASTCVPAWLTALTGRWLLLGARGLTQQLIELPPPVRWPPQDADSPPEHGRRAALTGSGMGHAKGLGHERYR